MYSSQRRSSRMTSLPPTPKKRALVIFGMQQDFFETLAIANPRSSLLHRTKSTGGHRPGSLPVPGAARVASRLRELLKLDFDAVIWCTTCHPINHCSFIENNPGSVVGSFEFMLVRSRDERARRRSMHAMQTSDSIINTMTGGSGVANSRATQVIRPTHCVEGTRGAAFHPDVRPAPKDKVLKSSTNPQSHSPGQPHNLLSVLRNIPDLGEVFVAGIGISGFVDTTAASLRKGNPSIAMYGLVDVCRLLNMGDNGCVLETSTETLDSMFLRAKIRPIYSEAVASTLKRRPFENLALLPWIDLVQALSSHLTHKGAQINRAVLFELLHSRDVHLHNTMPPDDWLVKAGFWDPDVIDTLHEISGENVLHAAAKLGDVVFVQTLIGGQTKKAKKLTGGQHHVIPAKIKLLIKSASNLPKSDMLGLSDPYAVIKIGPTDVAFDLKPVVLTTEVSYKSLNPVWNAKFDIPTNELSSTDAALELDIRIYDKDKLSSDDLLGEIKIPIRQRNCPEEDYPLDNCSTEASVCLSWQTTYTNKSLVHEQNAHAKKLFSVLTPEGHSALTLAVANGHGAVASLLVRSGIATREHINDRVYGDRGLTPLMYACINGDREMIKLLLAFGAEPRSESLTGTPALLFCTFSPDQNHLDSFETLLKSVPSHSRHVLLNQTDKSGWSALHTLTRTTAAGHLKWTSILPRTLSKVAVNALTSCGLSIMHLAAWNLSLDTLRLLLQVHKLADQHNKRVDQNTTTSEVTTHDGGEGGGRDTHLQHNATAPDLSGHSTAVEAAAVSAFGGSFVSSAALMSGNRFPPFVARQLQTQNSKHHTALDLSILRYLEEGSTERYTVAFECIQVLCSANFTASSTVGAPCQRVFDRILISGDISAVAGMLRSDDNAINLRSHHVTHATGAINYKQNACSFVMGSMEGVDQHMYYCRDSRTKVCQVCRDLCFAHKSKSSGAGSTTSLFLSTGGKENNQGLTYLGFLEGGVCECQQSSEDGHRCRAVDRVDGKGLAIKMYVPTSLLVPVDIRNRIIKALDGLIRELAYDLHANGKRNKEQQGWTVGRTLNEDLQTDPKLAPYEQLAESDKLSFQEQIITFVSTVNYAGFNIIGPISMTTKITNLPPELLELSKFLGHDAHERWAEGAVRNGWHYAPVWLMNAKPREKLDSSLVPFHLLSEYHQRKRIKAAADLLVNTLNFGYRIIAIDKMKLGQLVENVASTEVAGKPIVRQPSQKIQPETVQSLSKLRYRTRELLGTLLLASARWSLLPLVSELLSKGAEIDKQDRFGYTPLMLAVKRGHTAVTRFLIDQGANLEIRNLHHFTALMLASFLGNTTMIKLLLKSGSNILAIDHRRMMSLHHAAHTGHTDAVQILGRELTAAGFTVDICAPHEKDILAHRESEARGSHKVHMNVVISNNTQDNKIRGLGILNTNMLTNQFSRVMRHGLSRITSVFRGGGAEYTSTRAVFLTGSLSRAVHSKRNLLGAYDAQLSEQSEHTKFSPHELLLDRSLSSVARLAMKRGMVDGLSPLALAVKAGHLDVVKCLVSLGADPTSYDSTVFSPYERALIKSGEEEERIAADEARGEQSRMFQTLMTFLGDLFRCSCFFISKNNSTRKKKRGISASKREILKHKEHKHDSAKARALVAGKIVEALNFSNRVVHERCVLGCRNWITRLMVAVVLIGLLVSFSPVAPDHPHRHERIKPLKRVVTESVTNAIGTGTSGADAILKWWAWHQNVFFRENADFVASTPHNASYSTVRNSKDYIFVGSLLLHQQRYDVGVNDVDCRMHDLKACHTVHDGDDDSAHWTRPDVSVMENALDSAVNTWAGTTANIGTVDVMTYDFEDRKIDIPLFVALSLVNRNQSMSTLQRMQTVSWADDGTRFLFSKFSIFHQSVDDAYYCHVDVRVDFPATGGTNIEVEVQEFTSPRLHWTVHRSAPSVFFWVFVGTIATYHLCILIFAYMTLGWLRCVRAPTNWMESAMMGLMIVVGVLNSSTMELFNDILETPVGSPGKYYALYKVANLVKLTNDTYSLAFTLIFSWNVIKVFPQAPIIGPKMSAIFNTMLAVNQAIYLVFVFLVCVVFSFRWNIALFGVKEMFTTQGFHTANSYLFAIFRVPFADEFSNAMDGEAPRRPGNIYMEISFFVFALILTQNYIGVFVDNWDRENKRAEASWNEQLDNELRRKGMLKYNSNIAARDKAEAKQNNLRKFLSPALLLVGDDGLVFAGAGSTDHIHGAADREKRIDNAMNGSVSSLLSIGSSIDSMRNRIPEFKRDMQHVLRSARKILAKTHTSKMARKVHKFMHSQSVNRGQFGLARAPPQGRAPPRPNEEQKIALVPGAVRVKSEKALPVMKTPEPPPRPPPM